MKFCPLKGPYFDNLEYETIETEECREKDNVECREECRAESRVEWRI